LVFLRLQPYRQSSLKRNRENKLKLKFYKPCRVIGRIGEVAYELELPKGSKIHNVVHVSCLKKVVGQQISISEELPPFDEEGVNVYAIIIVLCISIDKSIIRTRSLRNTHSQETQHLSWETL
jgi:hypothetical protein